MRLHTTRGCNYQSVSCFHHFQLVWLAHLLAKFSTLGSEMKAQASLEAKERTSWPSALSRIRTHASRVKGKHLTTLHVPIYLDVNSSFVFKIAGFTELCQESSKVILIEKRRDRSRQLATRIDCTRHTRCYLISRRSLDVAHSCHHAGASHLTRTLALQLTSG